MWRNEAAKYINIFTLPNFVRLDLPGVAASKHTHYLNILTLCKLNKLATRMMLCSEPQSD
jgi:hypothetical protein